MASAVAQARRRVNNTTAARAGRAWTPWAAPTSPPPGTYDPTLDATLGQASRGLGDFQQDTERNAGRSFDDYTRGRSQVDQARGYEQADYGRSVAGLERSYSRLADSQRQQINAAGLSGGGAAIQAARKRAANMAFDRAPIDTAHTRAGVGFDQQLGQLALGQQRFSEDSGTALSRATREFDAFSQDTGAARFYQAAGTGWAPPPKPAGEGHRGNVQYRNLNDGTGRAMLPDGRIVSREGLRRLIAGGAGG